MRRLIWFLPLIIFLLPSPVEAQTTYFYPGNYPMGMTGIVWNGTWTDSYNTVVGMRHNRQSTTQYSGLEFAFFGTGYSISARGGVGGGVITYCRNGGACTNVDSALQAANFTFGTTGLTEGFHTVRAFLNSTGGLFFSLDTITIIGSALPVSNVNVLNFPTTQDVEIVDSTPLEVDIISSIPLEAETADYITEWEIEDSEANTQQVAFSYSLTAGELLIGMVGLAYLFIALVAFMFWLYTRGAEPNG